MPSSVSGFPTFPLPSLLFLVSSFFHLDYTYIVSNEYSRDVPESIIFESVPDQAGESDFEVIQWRLFCAKTTY